MERNARQRAAFETVAAEAAGLRLRRFEKCSKGSDREGRFDFQVGVKHPF
ncbi:MAG: hypothetical protein PHE53_11710 [Thermoguttaceae bacterium]|nr:hypothetical protein [Thermoguttaceae bacterium]